mgnify:CR=1 FL=1
MNLGPLRDSVMKYWIYINSYFFGSLNLEESNQFELQVSTNTELRKELEVWLVIFDLLEQMVRDFKSNPVDTDSEEIPLSILYAVYGIDHNTGEILPTEDDFVSDVPREYARGQQNRIKLDCQMLTVRKNRSTEYLMFKKNCNCLALRYAIVNKITYILKTHTQWNHQKINMVI